MIYIIAYLLNVFDCIATWVGYKKWGIEIELNPIGKWMLKTGTIFSVKLILIGALIFLLYTKRQYMISKIGIIIITVIYSLVCVNWILIYVIQR